MPTLEQWCAENDERLLREWDDEKNAPLRPYDIMAHSKKKVWWRCEKGHAYETSADIRTSGSGCPVCAGRAVAVGVNDLASCFPELAKQWHPTKNGGKTPEMFTGGSNFKAWWIDELGHEWNAKIRTRTRGGGCPICAGRTVLPGQNDLATTDPLLAREWHPTKNGALTPAQFSAGSTANIWWRCEKGHVWQARITARSQGNGCPFCSGKKVSAGENDLASFAPGIAAQWHPTKNGALRPGDVTPQSNRSVWWRCPEGHDYRATVQHRVQDLSGCPYCSGNKVLPGFNDLATTAPDVAAQWHPTLNGGLTPRMVTKGSRKSVWWICKAGHEWKAKVFARTAPSRPTGCPFCAGITNGKREERYRRIVAEAKSLSRTAAQSGISGSP